MTSSNGYIFRVTGHLCREFTGPGEFPPQRPVTRSFDVFFDLRMNKRLSKQSRRRWFETPPLPIWRHCNENSNAELWCFFNLRLNKRLSKDSWGWWFETLSHPSWRQCNDEWVRYYVWNLKRSKYFIHIFNVKAARKFFFWMQPNLRDEPHFILQTLACT